MSEEVRKGDKLDSPLGKVRSAEKAFLSGRRNREADLESAVTFFLKFLRGFESFDFKEPCVTAFGSARFPEGHPFYEEARGVGRKLARAGSAACASVFAGAFCCRDGSRQISRALSTQPVIPPSSTLI